MYITEEKLEKIYEIRLNEKKRVILEYLNMITPEFRIDGKKRMTAFLAQVGHESGRFRYLEELASGKAYEGRFDLGNTQPGDGVRFKGRGLIQITGRFNYEKISKDFDEDFVNHPELLCTPKYAVASACWFWETHGLNELADAEQFRKITKRINGGYNGMEDRIHIYTIAKMVL